MTAAVEGDRWPTATRRRLLDAAVPLFLRYSFAGTSLQMIAAELGLTKAAIYYHFRTREQLLIAMMAPILDQIRTVVEKAERQRGVRARAETMVRGYAGVVANDRALAAVTTFDPSVRAVLRNHEEWSSLIERQLALLEAGSVGTSGNVNAAVVMTGLAGAASSAPDDLDPNTLREQLIDVGMRTLGLPVERTKS